MSRAMLTWSHYKFKMLLDYKMKRSGGKMVECEEHYTTKTCSRCGRINRSITHKVFHCEKCELTMDRDVNAARNIFYKNEHKLTWALRARVTEDAYSEGDDYHFDYDAPEPLLLLGYDVHFEPESSNSVESMRRFMDKGDTEDHHTRDASTTLHHEAQRRLSAKSSLDHIIS